MAPVAVSIIVFGDNQWQGKELWEMYDERRFPAYRPIDMSACLFVCLSICLSVRMSVCLSDMVVAHDDIAVVHDDIAVA